ncbi:unnamed protein product [Caenorhabditis bovis]|uniref:Serpentine Receptor, class BC (Class B-like) n=1 Tax=Caenorhabditis bovis TaxID=2654633 RepID=A0A8S1E9W3_9PELO|nr:unnamed protein product [Caenorhabditis bovis]
MLAVTAEWRRVKKHGHDYILFYYRFCIDVFLGCLVATYLGFVILYIWCPRRLSVYKPILFYTSLFSSNIGAARSIISLEILIERLLAAYLPIWFHNNRESLPTVSILAFSLCFGIFEDVVLFKYCNFELGPMQNCVAFGCAVNGCFRKYWTTHKTAIFAFTGLFSFILSCKLFVLNKCGERSIARRELSQANKLALIDGITTFFCDFVPSLIANIYGNSLAMSFENLGPYGAAAKLLGCAVEAFMVARTILKKSELIIKASHQNKS